jgi:methylmalonyl-CoA mutase
MLHRHNPSAHSAAKRGRLAGARGAPTRRAQAAAQWPEMQKAYAGDEYVVKIRDKEIRTALTHTTCVRHTSEGRVADVRGHGEIPSG